MKFARFKSRIRYEFDLKKQADDLGVSVWQAPSFLFIVMGAVIVMAMTGVYFISKNYDSPEVLIISESTVVAILFTIGNFIIRGVDQVARANKMKTEFVSIASHQLKTPITEISWQIELLTSKFSTGLSEKQSELIAQVGHSSQKMKRLIGDLLDVARIDQGQLAFDSELIDLCGIVREAVASQQAFADSSQIDLQLTCPIRSAKIFIDKKRIAVVLDNLLSNAIKYNNIDGVVQVILEKKDDEIQICIRDNGVGIPATEIGNIFQKFYRSGNSAKNNTDGTGLGLYIAKNIIEQSGGQLWFHSIENVGSEFYFTLPIAKRIKKK